MTTSSPTIGSKCGLQKEKQGNSLPLRFESIIAAFLSGGVNVVRPLVKMGSKFSPRRGFFWRIVPQIHTDEKTKK